MECKQRLWVVVSRMVNCTCMSTSMLFLGMWYAWHTAMNLAVTAAERHLMRWHYDSEVETVIDT